MNNMIDEESIEHAAKLISVDFSTPKKKKKKDKETMVERNASENKHKKLHNAENLVNNMSISGEENNELDGHNDIVIENETTLSSKKKKKMKILEYQEIEKISSMKIDMDSEGSNSSVIENGTTLITPNEKKKKKKEIIEGSAYEEEINKSYENASDVSVEDENIKSAKKKSKKRNLNESIQEDGEEIEELDNLVTDENSGMVKKKKKTLSVSKKANDALSKKKREKKVEFNECEDGLPIEGLSGDADRTEDIDSDTVNADEQEEMNQGKAESLLPEEINNAEVDDYGGFTVIDEVKQIRRARVDRVLPEWLSNPTAVSMNLVDGVEVSDMPGLRPFIKKLLKKKNIKNFFPVQAAVIPELLSNANSLSMRYRPRDVCVSAPTGSGKTLAYAIPIIQALSSRVVSQIRAVVLLPTQELARQVHDVIASYTRFTKLRVSLAVGGRSLKKEQSTLIFQDTQGDFAADILVATPGKLSDHMNYTDKLSFQYLRYLVMDEADLFSSSSGGSFMIQVEKLLKKLPKPIADNNVICGGFQPRDANSMPGYYLQKILISATLMHDPEQLKLFNLHRPKLFIASNVTEATDALQTVGAYMRPQELVEEYIYVESTQKPLILHYLINKSKLRRVLVFTKSKESTHNLAILLSTLSSNLKVAEFSSNKTDRRKVLEDFYNKKINVLVSSDAMARGIDIRGIQQVVSYDVPSVQTYVHRCGRTGRAGKLGYSLSMVENTEEAKKDFRHILMSCKDRFTKIYVNEQQLTGYAHKYKAALEVLKETVQAEKQKKRGLKAKKLKGKPMAKKFSKS